MLERVHLVVLGAAGADDHDRRLDALARARLGDHPAVDAGQHQVDDRDVGPLEAQLAQAAVAVLGDSTSIPACRRCVAMAFAITRSSSAISTRGTSVMVREAVKGFAAPADLSSPARTNFRVASTARTPGFVLLGCPRRRRGKATDRLHHAATPGVRILQGNLFRNAGGGRIATGSLGHGWACTLDSARAGVTPGDAGDDPPARRSTPRGCVAYGVSSRPYRPIDASTAGRSS